MGKKPFKKIVAFDFDDTIHHMKDGWKGPWNIYGDPIPGMFKFMEELLNDGYDVVIHSSRARYLFGITAMRSWLKEHAVAQGCAWHEEPFGFVGLEDVRFTRFKPPAHITIDDRAITFNAWEDDFLLLGGLDSGLRTEGPRKSLGLNKITVEEFKPWSKFTRAEWYRKLLDKRLERESQIFRDHEETVQLLRALRDAANDYIAPRQFATKEDADYHQTTSLFVLEDLIGKAGQRFDETHNLFRERL